MQCVFFQSFHLGFKHEDFRFIAPKAHLHSSAKDGLGVPGFPYVRVTLILGFLKIFEFFLAEMEALHRFRKATVGNTVAPWIVRDVLVVIRLAQSH